MMNFSVADYSDVVVNPHNEDELVVVGGVLSTTCVLFNTQTNVSKEIDAIPVKEKTLTHKSVFTWFSQKENKYFLISFQGL